MIPGAVIFDMEYARWLEEHHRLMCELRAAVQEHLPDNGLRLFVDNCLAHYDELMSLKSVAVKSDVFHLYSGMWKTPAERCFMWMGGFRPSDLIKVWKNQSYHEFFQVIWHMNLLSLCFLASFVLVLVLENSCKNRTVLFFFFFFKQLTGLKRFSTVVGYSILVRRTDTLHLTSVKSSPLASPHVRVRKWDVCLTKGTKYMRWNEWTPQ